MKKIELDKMIDYHYLSALESVGGKLIYVDTVADMDRNDYHQSFRVLEEGDRIFYSAEKRISYDIIDDEIFLKENGDEGCAVSRLQLDGKKEKIFDFPLSVDSLKAFGKRYYLVNAGISMQCPEYYRYSAEEKKNYQEAQKKEEDYIVLDEYPYFYNGAGFINGNRSCLFLYEKESGVITPIVPFTMDVEAYEIVGDRILVLGNDYQNFKDLFSKIYVYDGKEGKLVCLFENEERYYLKRVYELNGKIYVHASPKKVIDGSNIYTLEGGKLKLCLESESMFLNSVGSDCHFGKCKSSYKDGSFIYFLNVDHNKTVILRFDGEKLEQLTHFEGDMADLLVKDGKIYTIGLLGMKLQEIYEIENDAFKALTSVNEKILEGCYVAKPEKFSIFNIDTIEGWALKPIDFDENKKYPCILDIHGGPKTAYGEVYFHEMQAWASMGYFVIFCNPHCSDGRGNDFADYLKYYGSIDYDDIMMFVDEALKRYPQIDEKRLGLTGGSYGGYMTNWIITHTDRFKCAASQRSISNRVADFFYSDYSYDVTHENGCPLDEEFITMSWKRSPLKYWRDAKTPTLFLQSTNDYRCPFPEALQLYSALKFNGVETRICGFKGENHELSRSGKPLHRLRRLHEITDWMDKYLK